MSWTATADPSTTWTEVTPTEITWGFWGSTLWSAIPPLTWGAMGGGDSFIASTSPSTTWTTVTRPTASGV